MQAAIAARRDHSNWDSSKDAFFRAVRGDAEVLWALFAPYRAQAAQAALTLASGEIKQAARRGGSAEAGTLDEADVEELPKVGKMNGASAPIAPAAPNRSKERSNIAKIASIRAESLLDTVLINGKPVGDFTARQAAAWARTHKQKSRFVELLVQNLPLDEPIRKYRSPDSVKQIYEQAKKDVRN